MTSLKIFFSCAFGALIGTFIALQLSPVLWWVGMPVGAVVGYLSYEFKKVGKAFKDVWKSVYTGSLVSSTNWKMLGWVIMASFIVTISAGVLLVLVFLSARDSSDLTVFLIFSICIETYVMVATAFQIIGGYKDEYIIKRAKAVIRIWNPIWVFIYYPIWGLCYLLKRLPKFLKKFFTLIHSDIRLLCACDAAIGTGIGYFFGSVVIGALNGGVLGVLNYYIVSIKILK